MTTLKQIIESGERATVRPWQIAQDELLRRYVLSNQTNDIICTHTDYDRTDKDFKYLILAANHAAPLAKALLEIKQACSGPHFMDGTWLTGQELGAKIAAIVDGLEK